MLSDFDYVKQNINILSKLAGIKIIKSENNNISCTQPGCGGVFTPELLDEDAGYVFLCSCGNLYYCVRLKKCIYMLEAINAYESCNENLHCSFFRHFDTYQLFKCIAGIGEDEYTFAVFSKMSQYIKYDNKEAFKEEYRDYLINRIDRFGENFSQLKSQYTELLLLIYKSCFSEKYDGKIFEDFIKALKELWQATHFSQIFDVAYEIWSIFFANDKKHSSKNDVVRKVKLYIENNLSKEIKEEELAQTVFVSRAYLCRIFKEVTGENILKYINRKRVEVSKYYLKTTDMSISNVAQKVGFVNANYYSKIFKKYTDVTPSQYKEQAERIFKNVDM